MLSETVIHNVIHTVPMIFALLATWLAWRAYRDSPRGLRKRMEALEIWANDLEDRHQSVHASFKKLNSRVAMRQAREKKAEADRDSIFQGPNETPEQWKRRMRAKLAAGGLKHADD